MIGLHSCPVAGVQLQPTVRLHCPIKTVLEQNAAVYAPIVFEEIVIVMII